MMTNLFPSTRRESGFAIVPAALVAIGFLIPMFLGGSDAPENQEMVGGPNAAQTTPETPTPASKTDQEPVDDGYGPAEPLNEKPTQPAAPEANVFVASDKTVIPPQTGDIIEGYPNGGAFRPSGKSVPLPLPEPEVLAEITLDGQEYTKFVSFKVIKGEMKGTSTIARELVSAVGGVAHADQGNEKDIVVFSRDQKPSQTVTKVTVTTEGITVVFRTNPSDDDMTNVQKSLIASAAVKAVGYSQDLNEATWHKDGEQPLVATLKK